MRIRSVAVLGAGTMGAQIAAHVANAGLPALLLDVTPQAAAEGLERASKLKPDPFFTSDARALIRTGGFDEHLSQISTADWIIEAIVERIDAKQALLARVDPLRGPHAIVSSNTSGIPLAAIAEGRSDAFRRHWLGTHFFNPPRYLQLLEVIPTPDTDPAVVETITHFADVRLGKGIVIAKDTPNFIANHLGLYGVMQIVRALETGRYTIEEIDAITGQAIGRPKSATFRTMDIVGIDVLAHVAKDLSVPPLVASLVERNWIGVKTGIGFYKREANGDILTLDPATMTHRPFQPPKLPSLEAAKSIENTGERIRTLFNGKDKVGEFLRETLGPTLEYAKRVTPEIAHSPDDVDRAMRWGFGWELGPFETIAALDGAPLKGRTTGEAPLKGRTTGEGSETDVVRPFRVATLLRGGRVVKKNAGASLVDIGDGVLCVEFHSKMNAIGGDTIQMLTAGVKEATANFRALVVGNDGVNFSAGANIMLVLLEAQEGNWDEIDLMVRSFQNATMALKYADIPVIVAPAGLALGGGCEIVLHADRVQAAAESYIGLVEVGVGLIPAGGGTKEMLARAMEDTVPADDPLPIVQRVFETIGFAKVSTSGPEAQKIGYLRDVDAITMNRERLLEDAKARAIARTADYVKPQPRPAIRVGGEGLQAALKLGIHLALRAARISEHDALIGRKLAWILAGGDMKHAGTLSEQQLLDLEREAFLSLCGERKTQERIAHTLKTGKPLRN